MCDILTGQYTLQRSFLHPRVMILPVNGRGFISAITTLMLVNNISPKPVDVVPVSITRCVLAFGLVQDNASLAVDTVQTNYITTY